MYPMGSHKERSLSPSLFNVSMDDLSVVLSHIQVGCNVNNIIMNYISRTVLLAPSPVTLQKLLDICFEYAGLY